MSLKFSVGDLTIHRVIEQETSFVPALTLVFGHATGNAWWHPGIVLAVMSAITLVAALAAARRKPYVDEV